MWDLNVEAHELDDRLALLDRLELECAVVSLQPTLGIDRLPADEARELFDAWEEGILELARAAEGRILPLAAREPKAGFAGLCMTQLSGSVRVRGRSGPAGTTWTMR